MLHKKTSPFLRDEHLNSEPFLLILPWQNHVSKFPLDTKQDALSIKQLEKTDPDTISTERYEKFNLISDKLYNTHVRLQDQVIDILDTNENTSYLVSNFGKQKEEKCIIS
ncbi:hypothetical protein HOH45_03745 [bacterium]|jgi:hypothetical protein|nr:hypothetical protein [bacterium]